MFRSLHMKLMLIMTLLIISLMTVVGAFLVMLSIRWELALVVFSVIPLFLNLPLRENENAIRILNRSQTVGNCQSGSSLCQPV